MSKLSKIITIVLSILCGLVFIASASSKFFPLEAFELSFIDAGIAGWKTAPIIARLMIGFEFCLGAMFIFCFRLKKFTIPVAAGLVIIFTGYLGLLLHTYGNRGNCGCFGDIIQMTPMQGLVKNVILLAVFAVLYFVNDHISYRFQGTLTIVSAIVLFILPFVLNPISNPFKPKSPENFTAYDIDLSPLYNSPPNISPVEELRKGKHVIAFMTLTCPHCRLAAKKLHTIKIHHENIPVFFVLNGKSENFKAFMDDTKCDSMPYIRFSGPEAFLKMSRGTFPTIYWANNSKVENETNYYELDEQELLKWLKAGN